MDLDDKFYVLKYNRRQLKRSRIGFVYKVGIRRLRFSVMKGFCYILFYNMIFEKILVDFCLKLQVVLFSKVKDRKLIEDICFKELSGNNFFWEYKQRKLDGKDIF